MLLLNSAKLNNIIGNKCKSDSLLFTGNMATVEMQRKKSMCVCLSEFKSFFFFLIDCEFSPHASLTTSACCTWAAAAAAAADVLSG